MKENVSGYLRNLCSLNRERDAALAAKLLALLTVSFRQRNLRSRWRAREYVMMRRKSVGAEPYRADAISQ
jgi:hypothetical protein